MTRMMSQGFMLGLVALMLAVFAMTLGRADQELILTGLALVMTLVSLALERVMPFERFWNDGQGDGWGDVISLGLIVGLLEPALKWGSPLALIWLLGDLQGPLGGLPLWAQILAVTALVELGAYLSHWLHHNNRVLWPLHAIHHSSERLYTLNNFRFHPLNHVLTHVAAIVPALALGASGPAVLGYVAITYPVILFQHSNIRFDFGWINYLFNTNEVHRWHHSAEEAEGNRNYGRALVIWDQLFGTFLLPGGAPKRVGLFRSSRGFPAPNRYFRQLVYPFSRRCCAPR